MSDAYLMWVGHKHYKTWADYELECLEQGVSKRVANVDAALLVRDKPVYLAHDNGNNHTCEECDGTGGVAWVDGNVWDFTEYRKHAAHLARKNRKSDNPLDGKQVYGTQPCETCGGRGVTPDGKVYGFFVCDGIDYILAPGDTQEVIKKAGDEGVKVVHSVAGEAKRGCGFRKAGGTYLTTKAELDYNNRKVETLVAELAKAGVVDPKRVEIKGSLAVFQDPIPIPGVKRFRGIKKWTPTEEIEAERCVTQLDAFAQEDEAWGL